MKDAKLMIDRDCPMCCLYGKAFKACGLLPQDGLMPYQDVTADVASNVDMHRAKNEIALYRKDSGETIYGIEAMSSIISQNIPWLENLLKWSPIQAILSMLYSFISYNRKVIYPTRTDGNARTCTPDYNATYRWAYLIMVALATGFILNCFMAELTLLFPYHPMREYIICFGQIFWQMAFISTIAHEKRMEYLGNMSTVSLLGGLMLIPVLIVESIFNLGAAFLLPAFFIIVTLMFFEHIRRCSIMNLPFSMTVSWVCYRMLILITMILF